MMRRVRLGRSPVDVSRVIVGCMWPASLAETDVRRLVHLACDLGVTSFDTAPLYDFGRSEQWLGRAVSDRRDRVQLLTKAGLRWDASHGRVLFYFVDADGRRCAVRRDSRPASLRQEVESSLRRLGVSEIDLLQIHHPDVDTPIEDALGELGRLRDEGKMRAIGVSNYDGPQLRRAIDTLGTGGLAALQCHYNLIERWPERELLPVCRAEQVGVLGYSPLAQGALAGRDRSPGWVQRAVARGVRYASPPERWLVDAALRRVCEPLANDHGLTVDQVSLAWLLARSGVSAVICGVSNERQLRSNVRAEASVLPAAAWGSVGTTFSALSGVLRAIRRLREKLRRQS